jgi:hypothetical protein
MNARRTTSCSGDSIPAGRRAVGRHRKVLTAPRFRSARRFRPLLHEALEIRNLLTANPLYLPPQFHLFEQGGYLTPPASGDPLAIALDYLNSHAGDLGLMPSDLRDVKVTSAYVSAGTGVTNIYLRQTVSGLEVMYADLGIHVTPQGEVINVGGGFVPGLNAQLDADLLSLTPTISAAEAVSGAAAALGLEPAVDLSVIDVGEDGSSFTILAPSVSLDNIDAQLHFVPTPDGSAALSWQLVVRTPDHQHWLDLSIDAHDSQVVAATDWMNHESYNVIPWPTESLNEGTFQVVTNPYLAAENASPFGWHDTNGASGPEFTDTRGNNVDVHLDRDANNNADTTSVANSKGRPSGGSALDFSGVTFNPALAPSAPQNQDTAMVNAFYWLNVMHDIHYQYGFTPAAGNFQTNNYGQGGLGNDAVQADVQDGANIGNTNNANFSTPPDGQAPRVQFFEYTNTTPRRDSALDASLIAHEYGHGVSRRLTGGPSNASSLNAVQSSGLNEGWSDWWSLMLLQQSASETTTGRALSTYLRGQNQSGSGIRDFRYDYDITSQTFETFLQYGPAPDQSFEEHDSGTRWAATLWDLNHLLIQKYGFDPNVYDSTSPAGNIRALQLVMTALSLQPANPSFIEARDAILLADTLLYGGVDHDAIWEAMARRGLGFGASTPSATSTLLTTSFDVPGLTIGGTTPARHELVASTPTSFVVNFSGTVDPLTLDAADLQVNGIPAASVVLSGNNQTAEFVYESSPVTAAGVQTMSLAADAVARASDGDTNDAFVSTFNFGVVPLQIVSTDPASGGGIFALPGPFTLDIHFNQPIDPSSVQTTDLFVAGISGASVTDVAVLAGNATVRFTIDVDQEGTLAASMAAGAITGTFANPSAMFTTSYVVDIDTTLFPTPFAFNAPLGSRSYDRSDTATINFAGDTDSFTLDLDARQKITVVVTSTSPTLQPAVQVVDPFNVVLGSTAAAGLDQNALLQTLAGTATGTYTITVGGVGATTGSYSVQVYLNGALEAADVGIGTNNTRDTAQDLNPAFLTLATPQGLASQAAVAGRNGASVTVNWADSGWWNNAGLHTASNKNYIAGRAFHDYFVFNLGAVSQPITAAQLRLEMPTDGYNSNDSTETFALFDVSTPLAELQASGTGRLDIFNDLGSGTSYGSRVYSVADNNTITSLTLNSSGINALNGAFGNPFPLGGAVTTVSGSGTNTQGVFASSSSTTLTKQLVLTLANTDYYSFSMATGQRTTIGLRNLQGSGTALALQNSSGVTIATGVTNGSFDQAISDFLAPAAGTYYVVVTASGSTVPYHLTVTRDASFDTEPNNSYATAQSITNTSKVEGAIFAGTPVVPSHLATTNGNSSNGFPFNLAPGGTGSMRYQQIYSKSEFNQPGTITAIRFRRNGGESAFTTSGIDVKINLSYAATTVDTVSSSFATNVGANLTTVLDTNALTLSSSGFGGFQQTNPFDVVINLTTPFVYDPKQGDLLMDVFMRNSPATRQFDFSSSGEQTTTRRIFATNVNNTTGTIDFTSNPTYAGLVTRFDMTTDEDWYQFNVTNTTHRLRLETSTPGDAGLEFVNNLNPRIELYSPTNSTTPLAIGTALADNRNEFIQFQPTATGLYRVRIVGQSATTGEYFLTKVNDAPRVVTTSVAPGEVLNPGSLTFQATFSQPMLASNLSNGDFVLHGNLLNIDYQPETVSFNDEGTVVTMAYSGLPDDNYVLTLTAGSNGGANFTNVAGNALDGEFASGVFPSGNGSAGGNFVLNFSLQPASELFEFGPELPLGSLIYDPVLARAIVSSADTDTFTFAADPGQTIAVLVQPNSATFRPTVQLLDPSGVSLGMATAVAAGQSVILQAVAANSTAAGTYKVVVSGASASTGQYKLRVLLNADIEALGTGPLGSNKSRSTAQDLGGSFITLNSSLAVASRAAVVGNVGSITLSAADSGWWDNTGDHSASNKNYVAGQSLPDIFRNYFVFNLGTVNQPIVSAQLRLFNPIGGYSGDSTETFTLFDVSTSLATLQASGSGQVGIFNDLGSGTIYGAQNFQESDEREFKAVPMNSSGVSAINAALGGQLAFGGAITTISGTAAQQAFGSSLAAGRLLDTRQLILTVPTDSDYYSFSLLSGQSATVGLKNVTGSGATIAIQDAAGTTLATGQDGATNLDEVIRHFVAPAGGTYYVVVTTIGSAATYDLVVTRDATFETEANDVAAAPQLLGSDVGVLGALAPESAFVPSQLASANGNSSNGFPFNIQISTATTMRYQQIYDHSEFSHAGQITAIRFRRNPDQDPFTTSGIDVKINLSQAATTVATVSRTFAENVGPGVTTVYDSDSDGLLTLSSSAVGDGPYPFDIVIHFTTPFDYDPSAGDLLLDVFMRSSPATAQFDFASQGTQSTTRRVFADDVDATLGTVDFTSNPTFAGLLTQFDLAPTDDWYTIGLPNRASQLRLETTTPGDGPNQFVNALNPRIELYDPQGTLVAFGAPLADGRNESLEYLPPAGGTYRVRVSRQGGTSGEYFLTKMITEVNVSPIVTSLAVSSPIDEGDDATLTGTIDDPNLLETHTVVIDWGPDEGTTTLDLAAGVLTFSATHQYLDDNPFGTSSDDYPISITVIGHHGGTASAGATVTVNNVDPTISGLAASPIEENGVATLTGTIGDVGTLDTFTIVIDWGNGTQTFTNVAAGPFDYSRQYLDDNLADSYSISMTLTDDDGGESTASTVVTVTNTAPTVTDLTTVAISETGTTTLSGAIGDVGTLDTFTLEIDWGNGIETFTNVSAGPFQYTRTYADDNAADSYPVHITVTDDDDGVVVADTSVSVTNLDPTATDNAYSAIQAWSVSGNVIADGIADHDLAGDYDPLVVDAVNGSTDSVGQTVATLHGTVVVHADGSFSYTPASTFAGDDSFSYTITDGDGGHATATVTIHVAAAAAGSVLIVPDNCLGGTALLITGTAAGDSIVVSPGSAGALVVVFNGVSTIITQPSGRIIVIGGNGDDNIQIAGAITNPVWLYGEAGNDRLNAGNGGSLLIGGTGDDHLLGGGGRDVMIGGEGADRLVGNSSDDILVAGYTTMDDRATAAHEEFWCHVLEEWNSSNSFTTRVQNLKNGAGGSAHNGTSFLLPVVREDLAPDAIDFLNGAAGDDWLIFLADEDTVGGHAEASDEP